MKLSTLLSIAIVACAFAAYAQQPGDFGPQGGGPRGGPQAGQRMHRPMGGPGILLIPAVQKELGLTQDQISKLKNILPPRDRQRGPGMGGPGRPSGEGGPSIGGPGGPGGEGGPGMGGPGGPGGEGGPGMGGRGGSGRQMDGKLKEILSAEQFARFKQVDLQIQGGMALARPEVAEKLSLSEAQREKIRTILERGRQARPTPSEDDKSNRAAMKAHHDKISNEVLAVLSLEQKSLWNEMVGRLFTMPEPPARPEPRREDE